MWTDRRSRSLQIIKLKWQKILIINTQVQSTIKGRKQYANSTKQAFLCKINPHLNPQFPGWGGSQANELPPMWRICVDQLS